MVIFYLWDHQSYTRLISMNLTSQENNLNNASSIDDQINFKFIYGFFIRNKKFISSFSLIFLLLGAFYSLTYKRVWEGQFQIVVNEKENANNQNLMNPQLSNFLGTNLKRDLKTEVTILKSPSILMPIFDYVVLEKNLKNSLSFTSWKKNLGIDLEKDTSVLNIAYKDTDKDLILPVLTKISEIYQDYSGKNKLRLEKIMQDYLTEQIKIYRENSSKSLKAAQEFSIEQDLIYFDAENKGLLNSDIESVRVQAANKLRKINFQLAKIQELGLDEEKLKYIGSTIPKLVEEGLPSLLFDIDNKLILNRQKYSDDDVVIQQILRKRSLLVRNLRDRAIGILNSEKIEVEALMEAAMRPKGILLKYKELIRTAQRDEDTLVSLENEKRLIDLEMAKKEDPWKLITKPTLLKDPVSPSMLFINISSLILGTIVGTLIAAFKERKSGKVYEAEIIEELLRVEIIESLNSNELVNTNENISFIKNFIGSKVDLTSIFLITLGEIENEYANTLKNLLTDEENRTIEVSLINSSSDFDKIQEPNLKIIIASLGNFTFRDIQNMRKKYWLAPLLITIILMGFLLIFSQGSVIAPFIYTIF